MWVLFQFGYVLERNFTRAFEIFTDLAADGSPAGQQVKLVFAYNIIYMYNHVPYSRKI